MNPTGISWADGTLNTLVGCTNDCSHDGEPYCYARKGAKRIGAIIGCKKCISFTPHTHWERLDNYPGPRRDGKPRAVFLGSMAGIWEPGAFSDADIQRLLDFVEEHPYDNFLTLTKNPERYRDFHRPANIWIGATITEGRDVYERIDALMGTAITQKRFISAEPLLGNIAQFFEAYADWAMTYIDAIIIGPLNHRGKTPTKPEWIMNLMEVAESAGVMVHLKPQCAKAGIPQDIIDRHQQVPWRA